MTTERRSPFYESRRKTDCFPDGGAVAIARLWEALTKLVNKLLAVHNDPEYTAVWSIYQVHVYGGYKGLTYTKELDEAKQVLAQKEGEMMVDTSKTSKDYELELYVTSAEKIQRLEAEIVQLKAKATSESWIQLKFKTQLISDMIKIKRKEANMEAEIAALKSQLSPLSSATPSYVAGLEDEIDRLRTELDRLRGWI